MFHLTILLVVVAIEKINSIKYLLLQYDQAYNSDCNTINILSEKIDKKNRLDKFIIAVYVSKIHIILIKFKIELFREIGFVNS